MRIGIATGACFEDGTPEFGTIYYEGDDIYEAAKAYTQAIIDDPENVPDTSFATQAQEDEFYRHCADLAGGAAEEIAARE
jgi:hypothetical protein